MSRLIKQNQIKGYMGELYSRSQTKGWNAPLRLIKEGVPKSTARYTGGGGFPNYGNIETNVATNGKPCLLPWEYRNVILSGYDQNDFYARLSSSPIVSVRDTYGGAFLVPTGITVPDQSEINEISSMNDVAVWLKQIKTVKECREAMGSAWHTVEPLYASGAFEVTQPLQNATGTVTKDIYGIMDCGAVVAKAVASGTHGTSGTGKITFTAKDCNDYDDWLVVDMSEIYARVGGSNGSREKIDPAYYEDYLPKVMYQCSGIGGVRAVDKTDNRGIGTFKPKTFGLKDTFRACGAYGFITIPCWGVPNGSTMKSWPNSPIPTHATTICDYYESMPPNGFSYGMGTSRWMPDAPWLRGHFNTMMLSQLTISDTTAQETGGVYKMDYKWTGVIFEPRYGWISPPQGEAPSSSILTDTYGAVQLAMVPKNKTAALDHAATLNLPVFGSEIRTPITTECYVGLNAFTPGGFRTFMAFPDVQHIIDFFADWGILASENLDDIYTAENPDSPKDPWDPEGFGPWDPGADPTDPWDNPTPSDPTNPDGPIVDYDPTNPGVDPLPPVPSLVSPSGASSSYIITSEILGGIQDWMLGDDFWNDSSNLFVNKMSAINTLTLFPFNVWAHDPNSALNTYHIYIAGALYSSTPVAYKMGANFDSRVRGGEIAYGKDWKSIHGTYRAFSNASYSVYVPFVGMVSVPASACVYRTLVLDYAVDYISGQATAILTSRGLNDNGYVVSVTPCQMGLCVPLYSDNYTQRSWAIMSSIVGGAFNAVTGGIGEGFAASERSATLAANAQNPRYNMELGTLKAGHANVSGAISVASAAVGAVAGGINAAVSNPIEFSHTGSVSPMNSWAVGLTPQLVVTEQVPAIPNGYEYVMGQPTSQRGYLYKFSKGGRNYVEAAAMKININTSNQELEMIIDQLKRGVFI